MICPICNNEVERVNIYGAGAATVRCCPDCMATMNLDELIALSIHEEG